MNNSAKNYIRNVVIEHYPDQILLGDLNSDGIINVLDVIIMVNMINLKLTSESGKNIGIFTIVKYLNSLVQHL